MDGWLVGGSRHRQLPDGTDGGATARQDSQETFSPSVFALPARDLR